MENKKYTDLTLAGNFFILRTGALSRFLSLCWCLAIIEGLGLT